MSNKDTQKNNQQKSKSDLYKINTEAIDKLVNADKKTYPKTNTDPGKKYRSNSFIDKIPSPIKALFIKFWFNGAVCFFIYWGLGMYIGDTLDMMVILGLIMGIVTDILVNNAFRFFAVTPDSNNKWMLFPKKKFWTFFANMVYGVVVVLIVAWIYSATNVMLNIWNGTDGQIFIGVEPILFGILYVAVDMIFVGTKNLIVNIITDAKEKAAK